MLPLTVAVGLMFTVTNALPEKEVALQFTSVKFVTVYVVVEAGATERIAGLVALVNFTPSDQLTTQGPIPVNAACIEAAEP